MIFQPEYCLGYPLVDLSTTVPYIAGEGRPRIVLQPVARDFPLFWYLWHPKSTVR